MKKTTILSTILSTILVGVLVGQAPVITVPVTEDGSTTNRHIEVDETVLTDGILLGGKADVDGSNITPSVWRSLLDVLTSGQIEALLEGYVQTVGGVGPDGSGDVSGISPNTLDIQAGGAGGVYQTSFLPLYRTDSGESIYLGQVLVSPVAENGNSIPRRHPNNNISAPPINQIDANVSDNVYISRAYVKDQAPTLALAPDQDVAEQFVYPRARIPEIGDGDKSWEYTKTIPISSTSLPAGSVSLHTARIPSYNTDGTYRGYGSVSATPASLAVAMYSTESQLRVPLIPSNNDEATSKQYVDTRTANLATAPAADVTEKRYSVELVVPASGDGDPYFEYVEIP